MSNPFAEDEPTRPNINARLPFDVLIIDPHRPDLSFLGVVLADHAQDANAAACKHIEQRRLLTEGQR